MKIVCLFISIVTTILFPILALPLNLVGMACFKGGVRKAYAFLLAFSLAMLAYIWIPDSTMDLYRHQQQLSLFMDFDFSQVGVLIKANLEPLQYIIKFLVSQTGNYDLLQFFVILCGYFELFWMACDYCQAKNTRRLIFVLVLLFMFAGVKFIDFASGLWCNFAIINIAMGVYLDYFKKTRFVQYIFYALAACLHAGTMYVVVLTIIISKFKIFKKQKIAILVLIASIVPLFGWIISIMNNLVGADSAIVSLVNRMYDGYFTNGGQFNGLHTGWNLILAIGNMILSFALSIWHYRKNTMCDDYSSFVMYLSICILITAIIAGVFIRYGFLLAILTAPLLVDYLTIANNKGAKATMVSVIIVLAGMQLSRSFIQIDSAGLAQQAGARITDVILMEE